MFLMTWNLLSKHFLLIRPESLCIPFKLMCAFNIDKPKESYIFDAIALANAIPWYHRYHGFLSPDEPLSFK